MERNGATGVRLAHPIGMTAPLALARARQPDLARTGGQTRRQWSKLVAMAEQDAWPANLKGGDA